MTEGPLKQYKGVIKGYKPCYARVNADQKCLILALDGSDVRALETGRVERIALIGADVGVLKGKIGTAEEDSPL